MQFISFMIYQFYHTLTSNSFTTPNFTDLFRITESILEKEKEDDIKIKEFIAEMKEQYINCEGLGISIPNLELIFHNNATKGFNYEIDIGEESFTLGLLFYKINNVIQKLTYYVSYVAYTYDVDMPFRSRNESGNLSL